MAEFNPIGDVGRTLRSVLLDGMGTLVVDDSRIALASPEQFEPEESGLSIHLYHVEEHAQMANQLPPLGEGEHPGDAPLVLELYYLVTAHPPNGETVDSSDTLEQHEFLSKAVHTFQEHAIISGSALEGSMPPDSRLHVSIDTDATDHTMDVWSSFQETPYLPSISYVVSPVIIEGEESETGARVREATMEHFGGTGR